MFGYYGRNKRSIISNRSLVTKKTEIPYTRFTRVPIDVKVLETEEIIPGRAFLFDMRPDSLAVFSAEHLEKGAKIAVVLEYPRKLYVKAEVVWCTLTPWNPKILSEVNFRYRSYLKLMFETTDEAIAVQRFCNSL